MQHLTSNLRPAWPDTTERDASGVMHIGGVSLQVLAQQFGTPLYVYDETTLRSRAGDIRDILNQVVTAEKQAQANLIRRREETAATRSLLNTAKLMEENPLLVRLKELEALEKIADKVDKITVVGGLNALLDRTVMLREE